MVLDTRSTMWPLVLCTLLLSSVAAQDGATANAVLPFRTTVSADSQGSVWFPESAELELYRFRAVVPPLNRTRVEFDAQPNLPLASDVRGFDWVMLTPLDQFPPWLKYVAPWSADSNRFALQLTAPQGTRDEVLASPEPFTLRFGGIVEYVHRRYSNDATQESASMLIPGFNQVFPGAEDAGSASPTQMVFQEALMEVQMVISSDSNSDHTNVTGSADPPTYHDIASDFTVTEGVPGQERYNHVLINTERDLGNAHVQPFDAMRFRCNQWSSCTVCNNPQFDGCVFESLSGVFVDNGDVIMRGVGEMWGNVTVSPTSHLIFDANTTNTRTLAGSMNSTGWLLASPFLENEGLITVRQGKLTVQSEDLPAGLHVEDKGLVVFRGTSDRKRPGGTRPRGATAGLVAPEQYPAEGGLSIWNEGSMLMTSGHSEFASPLISTGTMLVYPSAGMRFFSIHGEPSIHYIGPAIPASSSPSSFVRENTQTHYVHESIRARLQELRSNSHALTLSTGSNARNRGIPIPPNVEPDEQAGLISHGLIEVANRSVMLTLRPILVQEGGTVELSDGSALVMSHGNRALPVWDNAYGDYAQSSINSLLVHRAPVVSAGSEATLLEVDSGLVEVNELVLTGDKSQPDARPVHMEVGQSGHLVVRTPALDESTPDYVLDVDTLAVRGAATFGHPTVPGSSRVVFDIPEMRPGHHFAVQDGMGCVFQTTNHVFFSMDREHAGNSIPFLHCAGPIELGGVLTIESLFGGAGDHSDGNTSTVAGASAPDVMWSGVLDDSPTDDSAELRWLIMRSDNGTVDGEFDTVELPTNEVDDRVWRVERDANTGDVFVVREGLDGGTNGSEGMWKAPVSWFAIFVVSYVACALRGFVY